MWAFVPTVSLLHRNGAKLVYFAAMVCVYLGIQPYNKERPVRRSALRSVPRPTLTAATVAARSGMRASSRGAGLLGCSWARAWWPRGPRPAQRSRRSWRRCNRPERQGCGCPDARMVGAEGRAGCKLLCICSMSHSVRTLASPLSLLCLRRGRRRCCRLLRTGSPLGRRRGSRLLSRRISCCGLLHSRLLSSRLHSR